MTKKNTKKGTVALNPKFDSRILSIGSPHGSKKGFRRGWIASDPTVSGQLPGRVNFLFNPPSVSVSHPLNSSYASADFQTALADAESGGQAEWVANTVGQAGEVGVSLLFDRTYELWDRSYKGTQAGDYGVYADVLAFYKLLGIVNSTKGPLVGPVAPGHSRPDVVNFGLFPQNPLRGTPICYLYLGPNSLKFRGFVDNFNITYTHFSRGMIPIRCEVDLSMQMYMADLLGDDTGGGTVTLPTPDNLPPVTTPQLIPYTDPHTGITYPTNLPPGH